MKGRLLGTLFLATAMVAPDAAAIPAGYFVDPTQAHAPRQPSIERLDGDFTVSIRRDCPDAGSADLLDIAEATYPPREKLVGLAIEYAYEMGPDSSSTPLWWCDGVGAARVPYAITLGTIDYYTALTGEFRRGIFWRAGGRLPEWSELIYRASIRRKANVSVGGESFTNVYVAEMALDWRYDDGAFTSVIEANRVVVLSPKGKVLSVLGDGATDEDVSISRAERGRPLKRLR